MRKVRERRSENLNTNESDVHLASPALPRAGYHRRPRLSVMETRDNSTDVALNPSPIRGTAIGI